MLNNVGHKNVKNIKILKDGDVFKKIAKQKF